MITKPARSARRWVGLGPVVLVAVTACSGGGDEAANRITDAEAETAGDADATRGEAVASPLVTGPVTGDERGLPFTSMPARLAEEYGYSEEEFFIAGEASAYGPEGNWGEDGAWAAKPTHTAPYQTRMLVRPPADPEAFNGTVIVEWLNVTPGIDLDTDFIYGREELLRGGYVWVGASALQLGVEGGDGFGMPGLEEVLALKAWDPERYGHLTHPGDDYSYDIYSQVAQAVRRPDGVDPLAGLTAQQVIATGLSQSASWLVTYVNAVHPIADIYDGFLIHGRLGLGFALAEDTADGMPAAPRIRTDLSDPVMQLQTETDLFGLGFHPARQPDTERIRTWEVAGASHIDQRWVDGVAQSIREWDESYSSGTSGCRVNDGPHAVVFQAALAALTDWVEGDQPPAEAEPLEVADGALARDQHGNTLGGVRTPAVDVPVSTLTGEDDCVQTATALDPFFGSTTPFDQATLESLYPTHQDYVDAVTTATEAAVDAGFLLPIDGDAIIHQAEQAPILE